jgi:hypothetical protein
LTFNVLATPLVDTSALSMSIANLRHLWHFKVVFYCPQHKVHLCNYHAVYSASLSG